MLPLINRLKSDDALMLAYQRGDTAAFESLYHRRSGDNRVKQSIESIMK